MVGEALDGLAGGLPEDHREVVQGFMQMERQVTSVYATLPFVRLEQYEISDDHDIVVQQRRIEPCIVKACKKRKVHGFVPLCPLLKRDDRAVKSPKLLSPLEAIPPARDSDKCWMRSRCHERELVCLT